MEISRQTKKHMIQIIAFAILLYCGIQNFSVVVKAISFIFGIFKSNRRRTQKKAGCFKKIKSLKGLEDLLRIF